MKAYLVKNRTPLPPFQKAASQVRFRGVTVASRLRAQLEAHGLDVIERDALDMVAIEPDSIAVQDDVVLSSGFLRRLFSAIPNRRRNYQCAIDGSRFTLFSSKSAPASLRKLPLYYFGATDPKAKLEALEMTPPSILAFEQGLPPRIHRMTDLCVYFLDYYAVQLEYWFDIQTASSLYCREFVANLLRPFCAMLPAALVSRITRYPWLMKRCNSIGKNPRIHPTAILEGSVIGDGVEIGPFSYVRSSVIADGAVLTERSSVKSSYLGENSFLMGSDVVNSYVGAETAIFGPMLYNVVFGERSFLSGGSGFADFILGAGSINATIDGKDVPSNLSFLGSAVGDDCFLGANLIFAPGRTIPDGTRLLDHGLIKSVPTTPGGAYVLSGAKLLQVPDSFLGRRPA
jgi:acetyltransferase-like isoleucine patch superfamily enzyme